MSLTERFCKVSLEQEQEQEQEQQEQLFHS